MRRNRKRWMRPFPWSSADSRLLLGILGVGCGAFLIGYVAIWIFMVTTASQTDIVVVPDLRRMLTAEARDVLDDVDLELNVGDSLPNAEVPEGSVLMQSPLAGSEVSPDGSVRVIVSSGPERRQVPSVDVLTPRQATDLLESMGFAVTVQQVPSDREAGHIVGTLPATGTPIRLPTTLTLLVSSGPPLVAVPSLRGLVRGEASRVLAEAGLKLGDVSRTFDWRYEEGSVLSQSLPAGDSVSEGSAVDVVVATDRVPSLARPVGP